MGSRTLFEALTGYESQASADSNTPGLLGAGAAPGAGEPGEGEPGEAEFLEIIDRLQRQAEMDPELAKKFYDAVGFQDASGKPNPELLKQQLAEARQVVEEAQRPTMLGPGGGPSDFSDQQDALEGPALLGVPRDFGDRYIEEHVVERYRA